MFNKGFLLKVIFGGMLTITAGTGVLYLLYVKPWAPSDLSVATSTTPANTYDNCAPIINFYDRSVNEDDFRIYRRKLGAPAFALIQILPPVVGKGKQVSAVDAPLPTGTYEYKVSAYNQYGETFSDIKQVTVDYPDCAKLPPISTAAVPMNPIIVNLSIINDCSVRISYRDNSTNEQGFRIYRAMFPANSFYWDNDVVIANLGPHNGIPGTYDDKTKLPEGRYHYRISAYNLSGPSFSNFSEIEMNSVCNPTLHFLPTQAAQPLLIPTLQKLSTETCTWEAVTNVFLRKGPDVGVYDRLLDVQAGKSFPIVGQSEDSLFWAVNVGSDLVGYISKSEKFSHTTGDCSSTPTLKDLPPPDIGLPPTKNSGDKNNVAPNTPCPSGSVCP